jgi:hypothetical protein
MARPPKETIKPLENGRYFVIETTKKKISIWGLAFLFLTELTSFFLWENENYKDFYYPLLNQIAILILLINILVWKNILNFCNFKKTGLILLILYYFFEIFAMIFKLEIIFDLAKWFFLPAGSILLIYTFFKK